LSPLTLLLLYFFDSAPFKAPDTTKMGPPLHWTPTKDDIRNAAMNDFRIFVNRQYGTDFKEGDYWSLHAWSIANTETINQFWNAIWDFSGVIGDKGAQPVGPQWIPDDNFHEADPL
jgi:acetoacetyl-CoA synthetase